MEEMMDCKGKYKNREYRVLSIVRYVHSTIIYSYKLSPYPPLIRLPGRGGSSWLLAGGCEEGTRQTMLAAFSFLLRKDTPS